MRKGIATAACSLAIFPAVFAFLFRISQSILILPVFQQVVVISRSLLMPRKLCFWPVQACGFPHRHSPDDQPVVVLLSQLMAEFALAYLESDWQRMRTEEHAAPAISSISVADPNTVQCSPCCGWLDEQLNDRLRCHW
jgi:hypothetical protein